MTTIFWDGQVLAADSLGTMPSDEDFTADSIKIRQFDKPVVWQNADNKTCEFYAVSASGNRRHGQLFISALKNSCGKKGRTLNEHLQMVKETGMTLGRTEVSLAFVGLCEGVPVCYHLKGLGYSTLVEMKPGDHLSYCSTLIKATSADLSAVEAVRITEITNPKTCGGDIYTYDVKARKVSVIPISDFDDASLKQRIKDVYDRAVDVAFQYVIDPTRHVAKEDEVHSLSDVGIQLERIVNDHNRDFLAAMDANRFELEYGVPVQEFIRNYVKDAETHQLVSKELRKMRDKLIVQECETTPQKDVAIRWDLSKGRISQILKRHKSERSQQPTRSGFTQWRVHEIAKVSDDK
jgi:hypothetical protein